MNAASPNPNPSPEPRSRPPAPGPGPASAASRGPPDRAVLRWIEEAVPLQARLVDLLPALGPRLLTLIHWLFERAQRGATQHGEDSVIFAGLSCSTICALESSRLHGDLLQSVSRRDSGKDVALLFLTPMRGRCWVTAVPGRAGRRAGAIVGSAALRSAHRQTLRRRLDDYLLHGPGLNHWALMRCASLAVSDTARIPECGLSSRTMIAAAVVWVWGT